MNPIPTEVLLAFVNGQIERSEKDRDSLKVDRDSMQYLEMLTREEAYLEMKRFILEKASEKK